MEADLPTPRPSRWLGLLHLVGRHQLASAVTTLVDFTTMILLVQLALFPAAWATLAGAGVGAVVNFEIGRRWTFAVKNGPWRRQALRYGLVSGASAALNTVGEFALHDGAGVQYLAARALVAIVVSLAWNLPMQRHFVFRAG